MKAIQLQETGGPEVLKLVELPVPEPGPGQLLIGVAATGVNFIDIYFREGRYKAQLPLVPGQETAGTVERVGPGVEGFAVGDHVATTAAIGAYAEYALAPAAMTNSKNRAKQVVFMAVSRMIEPATTTAGPTEHCMCRWSP